VHIRSARLPEDKPVILAFIDGMQRFEHAIEPDRRIDAGVAEEFFTDIFARLAEKSGVAFIAEEGGEKLGWAAAYREQNDVYVRADEREFAHVSELYVVEAARGKGVGRALIAACEEWARGLPVKVLTISVLEGNKRAATIYRKAGFATYYVGLRKYLR
jgi:GNAT superfamily N-acetyltransferase